MKKIKVALTAILLLMLIALTACSPSVDSVSKTLKDNGYFVNTIEAADSGVGLQLKMNGIKAKVTASDMSNIITVTWYNSSSKAQEAYDKAAENSDEEEVVAYINGNMVAIGSQEAIDLIK